MPVDSFRTKRGVARFTADAVRIEESFVGYLRALYRDYWESDARWRKGVFAGYVFGLLFGLGWLVAAVARGDVVSLAVVFGALIVLWIANYLRGFRSPGRVRLDDVDSVTAIRGTEGLTRPRFVVAYADGDSIRKRRVNLLSLYTESGEEMFERAIEAFEQRGVDVERRETDG